MGKTCYIISQIGKPDTPERKWADFVKDRIISPVVTELGYKTPQRSDKDQAESMIMTGIVKQMFEADLVIADLTNRNPNVFYELGIRNCAHKPVIHLIEDGQSPPFDLAGNKAIFVSRDHERVIKAQAEIKERIEAIEKDPKQFYSNVQTYMQSKELDALKTAGTTQDSVIAGALLHLRGIVESNSDMLERLCSATVGKLKPIRKLGDKELTNLRVQVAKIMKDEQTLAEILSKKSSLTTTEPPEFDT